MEKVDEQRKDEIDFLLGDILAFEEEEINEVVKRVWNSKKYQKFYLLAYRMHFYHDKEMQNNFRIVKDLRCTYAEVRPLINYLISMELGKLVKNPSGKKITTQKFGLRNPDIHERIFKKILKLKREQR